MEHTAPNPSCLSARLGWRADSRPAGLRGRGYRIFARLNMAALLVTLAGCGAAERWYGVRDDVAVVPALGTVPAREELVEQAWSPEIRMKFWFTSQGSRILPYRWFTWLEQPNSTEYFRHADHMEELRYLPMAASPDNPSGLPIGFALDVEKDTGTAWLGLTCAACHTNQLDYRGTRLLIEGAPTLANFVLFYDRLVDAINETSTSDEKFERFARNVLGDEFDTGNAQALRASLAALALAASERRAVNSLPEHYPDDFTSYARLDAFGNIQNAGSAFALHDLNNRNPPTAPVSYPFLWGTHQSDVVQWNASAPNTPVIGPLVRNIGEVVGVFGGLTIDPAPWWQRLFGKANRYASTVDILGVGWLEAWVKELRSPAWPGSVLPPVDAARAAAGAVLFAGNCAGCHRVIAREDAGLKYTATRTPLTEVGTDPAMAWNADYHMANTRNLEGTKTRILIGELFGPTSPAIDVPVNGVVGLVLRDPATALKAGLLPVGTSPLSAADLTDRVTGYLEALEALRPARQAGLATRAGSGPEEVELEGLVYKARPLNGIWATAPFLHNGSVPNLRSLLEKPFDRPVTFQVGSREFDPVNVGYETATGLSEFRVLDEAGNVRRGNSNRGHEYGTDLTDAEKWQLVEYMKTL